MDKNLVLDLILGIIGLEFLAIVLLLVTVFAVQARKSGGRAQRRKALWKRLLPVAVAGDPETIGRVRASLRRGSDWKAFHSFIDERLRHEREGSMLGLRRLCRHVGLTERLHQQLLQARDPLDRAAAGRTLARLRERIAEDSLLPLLGSSDPAVVLAAAYAVASFKQSDQFLPVFRAVYGRTSITLHGAAELLSGFGKGVCPVVHRLLKGVVKQHQQLVAAVPGTPVDPDKAVDRADTAAQVVMVDLLAFYGYRPAAPTLTYLLSLSDHEEVLIHLVKAVSVVGNASAVPRLTELLGHSSWVVRRQSIQALAALSAVDAVPAIRVLLGDGNLMVRTSAQEALQTLKRAMSFHPSAGQPGEEAVLGALA